MIAHDTVPFRTLLAMAGHQRGVDVERCRVVLEMLSAANSLRGVFRRELEKLALSELDFAALVTLYAISPDHSALANVAAQTGSTRPGMTESADRLEARALIRRKRATTDRRVIYVEMTEEGRRVAAHALNRIIKLAHRLGRSVGVHRDRAVLDACRRLDEAARRERPTT